ncbi:hypothetical protein H9636_02675 [Ureibacillus sp. Re31]|uniref:DUF86 domain-containing protein n=1 Tax=Ureibacillus galli TaxID=2762222 RepID=A0ABR8X8B6_9BACL|nr:hypothetical protein [Ureibacillus galli]MBD8025555.1 hypothetical protein [Ureibacillus galli]
MEKIRERNFDLTDTVDALADIRDILENAHYLQQLVEEKFFNRCDVEKEDVQRGIIHDYNRFRVFSRILSDNVFHAEALLQDLLLTVQRALGKHAAEVKGGNEE